MKSPVEYLEQNIDLVLSAEKLRSVQFGVISVQRHCRIGYNQAVHTIEEMERRRLLCPIKGKPWLYQFNNAQKGIR